MQHTEGAKVMAMNRFSIYTTLRNEKHVHVHTIKNDRDLLILMHLCVRACDTCNYYFCDVREMNHICDLYYSFN